MDTGARETTESRSELSREPVRTASHAHHAHLGKTVSVTLRKCRGKQPSKTTENGPGLSWEPGRMFQLLRRTRSSRKRASEALRNCSGLQPSTTENGFRIFDGTSSHNTNCNTSSCKKAVSDKERAPRNEKIRNANICDHQQQTEKADFSGEPARTAAMTPPGRATFTCPGTGRTTFPHHRTTLRTNRLPESFLTHLGICTRVDQYVLQRSGVSPVFAHT